jgi:ribosomal protein S1
LNTTSRSAQTQTISINAGATINCTVAAIAHHPESGVIVTIEGNPNGFIPNRLIAGKNITAKAERRELLIANPGMTLEVFVEEACMAAAKVDESKPTKTSKPRPRIILNEDKVSHSKIIAARQEATARLRQEVAALKVGDCLRATVTRFATKANDDGQGTHLIGAFVQLENGMSALLHKSQMFDIKDVDEGAEIFVSIRSATMDGNRPKVSVKQISPSTFSHAKSKALWADVAARLEEGPGV